jgi:micrococcal nuclease
MLAFILTALVSQAQWSTFPAQIHSCYDGDTCSATIHLGMGVAVVDQRLRLCGVQAPELRGSSRSKGARSQAALWGWIQEAQTIQVSMLRKDNCRINCEEKGKYGRWLARIIADGADLNERLIREGFAKRYRCE